MENSCLEKKSVGKLVFNLAAAIRTGKAWTRQGYLVKITDVNIGIDDWYALSGIVYCSRIDRDCWALDGRYNIELDYSDFDLTTIEP